jgi:dTDP-glucose 4,6-dehydratase
LPPPVTAAETKSILPPVPAEDLAHIFLHTQELWEELRGQSVFITGGTGFFGIWLLESFAHANDRLGLDMRAVVLTRNPSAFARKAPHLAKRADLTFVPGDMRSFAFPTGKFSHVIHAASDTSIPVAGADPEPIREAIFEGTRRVLDFATQTGAKKFLLTSSGAVYGPQSSDLTHIPEEHALWPATPYGVGKQVSEELCLGRAREAGFECKVARCFAFVGPHLPLDSHFAIGNFIRDARRGGPIRVAGDGTPTRSYLYAADLAVWLWTLLFAAPAGRVYNVGSDDDRSIAAHARLVEEVAGLKTPVQIARAADHARPVSRYVPSVRRARQELGLQVRVPEAEGIRRTLAWLGGEQPDFSSQSPRPKLQIDPCKS